MGLKPLEQSQTVCNTGQTFARLRGLQAIEGVMMFDDSVFEEWLNQKAIEVFGKLGTEQSIKPEEMIVLVLKAQANHFMHLDSDLRGEMKALREDMDRRFEAVDKRFEEMRKDMNRRFEAVDKRFASTQWLIGTGIALLAMMIAFFQFF